MRGVGRGTSLSTAARFENPVEHVRDAVQGDRSAGVGGEYQGTLPLFPSAFEKRPSGRQMAK